jgi:dTDP-4-dehydrorhamnose reductase
MNRLLITGGTGLLGGALTSFFNRKNFEVVTLGKSAQASLSADLTNLDETTNIIKLIRPNIIINLIANTNVDLCEIDINSAYRSNVLPIKNLCQVISDLQPNTHIIHFSTDMVYDGVGLKSESDVVICNNYALSKLAGELVMCNMFGTVIRTNFFGKSQTSGRVSFSDWIINSLSTDNQINVFEDVFFSPLSMDTLCEMVNLVINQKIPGLFNLGSRDGMSKADFAYSLASLLKLPIDKMKRIQVSSLPILKALRPKDMRMDSSLFEKSFNVKLPSLYDEILKTGAIYYE